MLLTLLVTFCEKMNKDNYANNVEQLTMRMDNLRAKTLDLEIKAILCQKECLSL